MAGTPVRGKITVTKSCQVKEGLEKYGKRGSYGRSANVLTRETFKLARKGETLITHREKGRDPVGL